MPMTNFGLSGRPLIGRGLDGLWAKSSKGRKKIRTIAGRACRMKKNFAADGTKVRKALQLSPVFLPGSLTGIKNAVRIKFKII